MPDALHPNAAGQELLAQCLDPLIHKLMQAPSSEEASSAAASASGSGGGD